MKSTLFLFLCGIAFLSCNRSAQNSDEAVSFLQDASTWNIDRITVNDRVVMKDGQSVPSFDGVTFDRYMSSISFSSDGKVNGIYNKGSQQTDLVWAKAVDHIEITAPADAGQKSGGGWQIDFSTIYSDSFAMHTSTTAYDFPRTTKIVLYYKVSESH